MVEKTKKVAVPDKKGGRENSQCRKISSEEKRRLFDKYIAPNMNSIYTLVQRYANYSQDVDAYYNIVLTDMYNYIASYDESKSLKTWLHIVTKRTCFHHNKKDAEERSHYTDVEMCSMYDLHQHGTSNIVDAGFGTIIDNVSEKMRRALTSVPPNRLSPFLLFAQGYGIKEIAKMEHKAGHLDKCSGEEIKSRIYWARKQITYILEKNGITGKNLKGCFDD